MMSYQKNYQMMIQQKELINQKDQQKAEELKAEELKAEELKVEELKDQQKAEENRIYLPVHTLIN